MKKVGVFALIVILATQVTFPIMAENKTAQPAAESSANAETAGSEADSTDSTETVIYSNEFPTELPNSTSTVMVGTTVGIKKLSENTIKLKVIHCARTAIAETSVCDAEIIGNKASFNWEDPNYMSYGDGKITFYDDYITISMHTINGGRFSFSLENETLKENFNATFAEDFLSQLDGAALNYTNEPGPMDQSMAVG